MGDYASPVQLSVLDLPQLHLKPSFTSLQQTLLSLAIRPLSWDLASQNHNTLINEDGIPAYLTRIIASSLKWLSSTQQEEIWELTSTRLSERSGRSAMSSFNRSFRIPSIEHGKYIEVTIHEPALTGDKLGHKTWLGAYVMAKELPKMFLKYFPSLVKAPRVTVSNQAVNGGKSYASRRSSSCSTVTSTSTMEKSSMLVNTNGSVSSSTKSSASNNLDYDSNDFGDDNDASEQTLRILELGAGTGLAGLAASALFPDTTVTHLTDLPAIVPNIIKNIHKNIHLFHGLPTDPTISAFALDWSALPSLPLPPSDQYHCILAADSLYGPIHPSILTKTMRTYLLLTPSARIFTVLPYRTMDRDYHAELRQKMETQGFVPVEEGEEQGVEDWEKWREREVVRCWWCVWGWAEFCEGLEGKGERKRRERRELVWGELPELREIW